MSAFLCLFFPIVIQEIIYLPLVSENLFFFGLYPIVRAGAEMDLDPDPVLEELGVTTIRSETSSLRSDTGFSVEEVNCLQEERHLIKTLENESVYFGRRLTTDTRVPANIHKPEFYKFWSEELKPNAYLLDIIKNGYRLPFKSLPPSHFCVNNKSARLDEDFVRSEVFRLEKLNCIYRVEEKPYLVLPLSSIFSKKKRLVIDASRHLNPYLEHRRVRLQDHRDIKDFVKKGDYFCIEDLGFRCLLEFYCYLSFFPLYYFSSVTSFL